jgi:hypothetical protein
MNRFGKQVPHLNDPATKRKEHPSVDPAFMDPGVLRNAVLEGFSVLGADEAGSLRDSLLRGLSKAGLDVGASLFLIGRPADRPDELTWPDLAHLVRYVRINRPGALAAVQVPLARLITMGGARHTHATQPRRAA